MLHYIYAYFPQNHTEVAISLLCEFPPNYPSDGPPILTIKGEKGLSATQVEELQTLADSSALENVGMASIFTVTEVVKEWLADNNIAGQDGSMYSGRIVSLIYSLLQTFQTEPFRMSPCVLTSHIPLPMILLYLLLK